MKPKRDYDPDALGVQILLQAEAMQLSHNAQDKASLGDEAERFAQQREEDWQHPAFTLRDEPDTAP